jgi:hypothetical protein
VGVDRHGFVREFVDDLDLVGLVQFEEELLRLLPGQPTAGERLVALYARGHLFFDGVEILGGEGPLEIEIVIEAVLDVRADGHLGLREETLYGLGHDVGSRVAEDREPFGRIGVDRGDALAIDGDRRGEVDQPSIAGTGNSALQPFPAERLGDGIPAGLPRQDFDLLFFDLNVHVLLHTGLRPGNLTKKVREAGASLS